MKRQSRSVAVLLCALLGGPTILAAGPVPPAIVISPNYDLVVTNTAYLDMSAGGLGLQQFVGVPLGNFNFAAAPTNPPARGTQNALRTDTIIYRRMDLGDTLNTESDHVTTTIDVVGLCLKSKNQLNLGHGATTYYATLDTTQTNGGTMKIQGNGFWTNDFTIHVDLRRGSKTGDVDFSVTKHFHGTGAWAREPSGPILTDPNYPTYKALFDAITYDPNGDGEFFLLGDAFHDAGSGSVHGVVDLFSIPEPSTGVLLLAGGLAVVWRKRRSRVAA